MKFEVEVSFVGPKRMRELNKEMRGRSYTPAVLSFAYFERIEAGMLLGEVLICKSEVQKLARKNEVTLEEQINRLVVHGIKCILGAYED